MREKEGTAEYGEGGREEERRGCRSLWGRGRGRRKRELQNMMGEVERENEGVCRVRWERE